MNQAFHTYRHYFQTFLILAGLAIGRWSKAAEFDLIPQMIHEYALNDIAYAPNGLWFASASYDRVTLWEIATSKQIRSFPGMGRGFTCVAFSPDGTLLAAGATDQTVVFWDRKTGELVRVLVGHQHGVRGIAFSPDGRTLASVASSWKGEVPEGEEDQGQSNLLGKATGVVRALSKVKTGELKFWDVASGEVVGQVPESSGAIEPLAFSKDGQTVASGGIGFTIGLWDVATGQLNRSLGKGNQRLQAVAFTAGGEGLVTAIWGKDLNQNPARGLLYWELATGTIRHNFSNYTGFVQALSASADNQFLVTAANDAPIFLSEKRSRSSKVTPLNDGTGYEGEQTGFEKFKWEKNRVSATDANGNFTINSHQSSGEHLSELRLWRLANGKAEGTFYRGSSPTYTAAISPDGNNVIADARGESIGRWRVRDFTQIQAFQGVAANIIDMVYSPDGRSIGQLDGTKNFRVWDVGHLRGLRLFDGHKEKVNAVAFSPDSKKIASASEDKTIKIWDLASGELEHTLDCEQYPRALAFSPDGRHLVSLEWPHLGFRTVLNKNLIWWDMNTFTRVVFDDPDAWKIKKAKYNRIEFSADGQYLLLSAGFRQLGSLEFASEAATDIWEVASGQAVGRYGTCDAAAFSRDGQVLATAKGANITVWRTGNHELLHQLEGHELYASMRFSYKQVLGITSLAISPDCAYALSCATDKTMRLWDLRTGKNISTKRGRFQLAQFSPNGSVAVTADFDGRLQIWETAALASGRTDVAPSVTLIGLPECEEFVAFTPELKYKSTRIGYRAIVVLKNDRAYGFDQFDAFLNRPDLVVAKLPDSDPEQVALYRAAYEKRLHRLGLTESQLELDFHLPQLSIHNDVTVTSTAADRVQLHVSAQDDRKVLDRIMVWVNGVPLHGRRGFDLSDQPRHATEQTFEIPLNWGGNTIEAAAINSAGVTSYRRSLHLNREGKPPKPKLFLLALGVSDYFDGGAERDLKFAAKDAQDLVNHMLACKDMFSDVDYRLLLDGQVTREAIQESRAFLEQAGVGDLVVVFMAGHGLLDGNRQFYFGTHDIDFNQPGDRGFAFNDVETLVDGLACRQKLVLLDACHSGLLDDETGAIVPSPGGIGSAEGVRAFTKTGTSTSGQKKTYANTLDLMQETFVDLDRASGTPVIASARGDEFAYEKMHLKNGVFTNVLIEGLTMDETHPLPPADMNGDRQVDVTEWRDYTAPRVKRITEGRQTPASRGENLNYDFPVITLPPEDLSWFARVKKKTVQIAKSTWQGLGKALAGEVWEDLDKPSQRWGKNPLIFQNNRLNLTEAQPPPKARFPMLAADFHGKWQQKFKRRTPSSTGFAFTGHGDGRKGKAREGAAWVFPFPRADESEGLLYVTLDKAPQTDETLIREALAFDYTGYDPVHKQFLQRGRNAVVTYEWVRHGNRDALFLITTATYDAGQGSLQRIYYHLLIPGETFGVRLSIAGGHESVRKDAASYSASPEFALAARDLFARFELTP